MQGFAEEDYTKKASVLTNENLAPRELGTR